jgi:hypothetical protein
MPIWVAGEPRDGVVRARSEPDDAFDGPIDL